MFLLWLNMNESISCDVHGSVVLSLSLCVLSPHPGRPALSGEDEDEDEYEVEDVDEDEDEDED